MQHDVNFQQEAKRAMLGLGDVAGLRYKAGDGVLHVIVSDPPNHNALTKVATDSLYETLRRFHELPFDRLEIAFDTASGSVACAGLNLNDFEAAARRVSPGEDLLGEDNYFVRVTQLLRELGRSVPTMARVEGHLVGAGVELALSCREVVCARSDIKVLMPHLRIGVPYHTLGLCHMAGLIGWDVMSRAMVTDAIPVLLSEVLADRERIERFTLAERIADAKIAIDRMAAVFQGRPARIGDAFFTVEDRTGETRNIAEAHLLQILAHVAFVDEMDDLSTALHEIIDAPRVRASSCVGARLAESIAAHRQRPKRLNRHFSKAIGAGEEAGDDESVRVSMPN
ncbi:enoyl-CoA hydratase/isomerase family protein [Methylosinus sp. R-45379]|uniref:enoyl-CoA hydratase/isomerase family protein n=1 Tax=Methylosinus sp. R-45379 TaxID=980563 RepID=UPI000A8BFA23|nr:enoyl-CoA hydratase/isomerase family protein [Methylosinus sp. R-45379]